MPVKSKRLPDLVLTNYLNHGCVTHGAALAFYALFVLLPVPIFVVSGAAALVGSDLARAEAVEVLRALAGDQMAGSLVLTLTWIYYSALAFLFGAELTPIFGVRGDAGKTT